MGVGLTRSSEMLFYVFFEKSIFSRFPFQLYTRSNDLKFEIQKNLWGGAPWASSPDPSPALSRTSPSIRASPDSDPQLLKRGCALVKYRLLVMCHSIDGELIHSTDGDIDMHEGYVSK